MNSAMAGSNPGADLGRPNFIGICKGDQRWTSFWSVDGTYVPANLEAAYILGICASSGIELRRSIYIYNLCFVMSNRGVKYSNIIAPNGNAVAAVVERTVVTRQGARIAFEGDN